MPYVLKVNETSAGRRKAFNATYSLLAMENYRATLSYTLSQVGWAERSDAQHSDESQTLEKYPGCTAYLQTP